VTVEVPGDVPQLRDRLHKAGIDTFEADVRFASRYLIERGIKGGCEIEGECSPGPGTIALAFDNPLLRAASVGLAPRVLSFDIETDPEAQRLLAISLYAPDIDEVLIVDPGERALPERATRCVDEAAALDAFAARVAALDPDVITGWNTIDFDLTVLVRIAARLRRPLILGREPGSLTVRKAEGYFGSGQAQMPGRLVLDGIDLLRGAFVRMDDYSLDAVAREVLGEGKAVAGDPRERIAEIQHNYLHDLAAFALYARTDARLAYRIVEKLDLIRLAFARSELTGMTPDRVAASIASFDFLYLSELERRRIVAPSVRGHDARGFAAPPRDLAARNELVQDSRQNPGLATKRALDGLHDVVPCRRLRHVAERIDIERADDAGIQALEVEHPDVHVHARDRLEHMAALLRRVHARIVGAHGRRHDLHALELREIQEIE
jgi:DNA polymerase-2